MKGLHGDEGKGLQLTNFIVAYVSEYFFEHFDALGGEHVEASCGVGGGRGEPCVVFVCKGAGFEAGGG